MVDLKKFEQRIDSVRLRHPEMPRQAVMLVRLAYHTFRALNERLDAFFARNGLSSSAWSVLMMIYSDPRRAIYPSEASAAMLQSRTHMTRVADELTALGLVERVPGVEDRRRIVLRMTPKGVRCVERILPRAWTHYQSLLAGYSGNDIEIIERLLRKWLAHLRSCKPAAPADGKGAARQRRGAGK